MTFKVDKDSNTSENVILGKFVYHEYLDKQNPGEFRTAITPKSAITKLLTALGWTFSTEDVDPEEFIGNWVEANVNDYESGEGDTYQKSSTIESIQAYEGPEPSKDLMAVKPKENKEVKKQVKHDVVGEAVKGEVAENRVPPEGSIKELQEKINVITKMHDEGTLTDQGFKDSKEQLETQLEELNKK